MYPEKYLSQGDMEVDNLFIFLFALHISLSFLFPATISSFLQATYCFHFFFLFFRGNISRLSLLPFSPNLSVENSVVRKMTRTSTKKNPAVIIVHIFPSFYFFSAGEEIFFHFFFLW